MNDHAHSDLLPDIQLPQSEEQKLLSFIPVMQDRKTAAFLLSELERARVVDDGRVPNSVVRMEAAVTYIIDERSRRTVKVVYPGQADLEQHRISVLTPVGAALIGMSAGQSIWFEGPDARPHRLTVVTVVHPDAAN